MNSRLYIGEVIHARNRPVRHPFRYPVYTYGFDIDELPELDRRIPFFGYNRLRPIAVHDRDYLRPGAAPLRAKVVDCLREHNINAPVERVFLVTSARFLNYVFNPVSFFHCYATDNRLLAVIAFVNNTFGESHIYVLPPMADTGNRTPVRVETAKTFHVSPFFTVAGSYRFEFGDPAEGLDIHIHLVQEGQTAFAAQLTGVAVPLTAATLARTIARRPLTAALTVPRILGQAARLYWRHKLPIHPKPPPTSPDTIRFIPPARTRRWAMTAVCHALERLQSGRITLRLPDRTSRSFGAADAAAAVNVDVHDYDFFWRILAGGEIGFGESYVDGHWDCDDLTGLLTVFSRSLATLEERPRRFAGPKRIADRLAHLARANTLIGSRRNIHAHYDLSNDFFRLFLDDTMCYSCAVFERPDESLASAQRRKLRALIDDAQIGSDDHVLEIGCGWGGFAIEAAGHTGCRVTGITISDEQYELASRRVRDAGLADRVTVEKRDYRDLVGRFDKVVSVEMLEAVGHRYLGAFFAAVDRVLKPGGRVALQVITIPDQRYDQYRRTSDWIRKHIFPGGHLPSLTALSDAAARNSLLTVDHLRNIGDHYATTLRRWRDQFECNIERARALGFDEPFLRKWRYYLSYCEAGFATRILNNLQIVMRRAGE